MSRDDANDLCGQGALIVIVCTWIAIIDSKSDYVTSPGVPEGIGVIWQIGDISIRSFVVELYVIVPNKLIVVILAVLSICKFTRLALIVAKKTSDDDFVQGILLQRRGLNNSPGGGNLNLFDKFIATC